MAKIPTTSTTLLRDVASDSQHARWTEFAARYRPMMEAYLRERFPSLDADDVIQETLVAVWEALPSYRYVPEEKGRFHNYLTGILRNKALRQLYKDQRHAEIAEMVHDDASCDGRARTLAAPSSKSFTGRARTLAAPSSMSFTGRAGAHPSSDIASQCSLRSGDMRTPPDVMADDEQSWREALVEIALRQLMNDESIQSRTRQVFLRVAVNGEKPDDVAVAFGIKRNAVDQIKHQVMLRLRKLVSDLEKAGNI